MASTATSSKTVVSVVAVVVVDDDDIYCLLMLPMFMGFCVWSLFCYAVLCILPVLHLS